MAKEGLTDEVQKELNDRLIQATRNQKTKAEEVRALIEEGADVNAKDGSEKTALGLAAERGNIAVVRALIEAGADVKAKGQQLGKTALHYAAENGETEVFDALIDAGADVDDKDRSAGKTALHYAAQSGNIEVVDALIKKGANVKAIDLFSNTALHIAAKSGRTEVFDALIEAGADIHAKDRDEKTALEYDTRQRTSAPKGAGADVKAVHEFDEVDLSKQSVLDQLKRTLLDDYAKRGDVSEFAKSLNKFTDSSLATLLTFRDKHVKRPLDVLAENVKDPKQKKELVKIAKHIGGILRERNPELKKHASLWQGLTDVYQSFCQKIGITTERARVKAELGLQRNSTEFAKKLRVGLSSKMTSITRSTPSVGTRGGHATHGRG